MLRRPCLDVVLLELAPVDGAAADGDHVARQRLQLRAGGQGQLTMVPFISVQLEHVGGIT